MRNLPLYEAAPRAGVEAEPLRLSLDHSCKRCALGGNTLLRSVCIPATGEPGGLLVVGEGPGKQEDMLGQPFVGASGKKLRDEIAKHWKGPVAIDNATRCYPSATKVEDRHVAACRPYLAQTFEEVRPSRVVILGKHAAAAVFGRSVPVLSVRGGYRYMLGGAFGEKPIPAFYVVHPAAGLRNSIVMRWFREDLRRALTWEVPPLPPLGSVLRVVETPADSIEACEEIRRSPWCGFDIESAGIQHSEFYELLAVSVCGCDTEAPFSWTGRALKDPGVRGPLADLLADPRVEKRGQNVKFDAAGMHIALQRDPRNVRGDARLWRKLLDGEADASLDTMVELVGMGGMKDDAERSILARADRVLAALRFEKLRGKQNAVDEERKKKGLKLTKRKLNPDKIAAREFLEELEDMRPELVSFIRREQVEVDEDGETEIEKDGWRSWAYALLYEDELLRYNARDVVGTNRVIVQVEAELEKFPPINRIRHAVVDRAAHAVRRVEEWGVGVSPDAIRAFDLWCDVKLADAYKVIAPYGINPGSHSQCRKLLFETLGLKPRVLTDSGLASTKDEVLEELKDLHPVAGALADWRGFDKLRGNYAGGMLRWVRQSKRGPRVHPNILLDGARSGRMSVKNPPLQTIPSEKKDPKQHGRLARNCFVSPPGFELVSLDYSQIELRVAAMLSGDPEMKKIFDSGTDFHLRTAQLIAPIVWKISPDQVTKEHRSFAKTTNFGILYGMGDGALAARLGCSIDLARKVRDAVLGTFHVFARWCRDRVDEARRTGFVWTVWQGQPARRRSMYRIASADDYERSQAENGSFNTPIQGTATEFCTASFAKTVEWIEEEDLEPVARLVLPVHDQLLLEVRRDYVQEVASNVRRIMLSHESYGVRVEVDVEHGEQWGELEALEIAA